ncbi:Transposase and inactivated derivatives-like [Thermosinus carboxydivorans Nor1]|uniref:Transposase and inactivated derivatives-like n=1 Tax=Thermosinus carboxydivorans Nor1 TaxID=401526 RepID=A1HMJ1_9FIRM|nr:Transposase and inactivated derivatives-like [Thermosinus carboxydivorans Nor1]
MYHHRLGTRVGAITLKVPRFRDGKFSTELFVRYQRSEQVLVLTLLEMVVNGVSTRKVAQITEEFCSTEFSKSAVLGFMQTVGSDCTGLQCTYFTGSEIPICHCGCYDN